MKTSCRVLVCDDVAMVRQAVRQTMDRTSGFNVVAEAVSGQEAVDKAIDLRPDLVVMDVYMTDLDGIEATRLIRDGAPEVKVLAFSSDSKWETVDRVLSAGAAGYVVKGPDLDELLHAAKTTLAGGHYLSCAVLNSPDEEI